jgi:hypothetical protein
MYTQEEEEETRELYKENIAHPFFYPMNKISRQSNCSVRI